MNVLIVQYHIHYEGSEIIAVCANDVDLAKRLAQVHCDESYNASNDRLVWEKNQFGNHIANIVGNATNYSIVPYEMIEQ